MKTYALTFVSKDRPGIVADVTKVLYEKGFNIADSSSTRLQQIFSMILLVQHTEQYTAEQIKEFFKSCNLKPAVHEVQPNGNDNVSEDNFIISVYGADKPGIVHSITAKLYDYGINILDLQTQATGVPPKEVYIMVLEVSCSGVDEKWQKELKSVAATIGTDINIRPIEVYEL